LAHNANQKISEKTLQALLNLSSDIIVFFFMSTSWMHFMMYFMQIQLEKLNILQACVVFIYIKVEMKTEILTLEYDNYIVEFESV